jgi:hypothetical protein
MRILFEVVRVLIELTLVVLVVKLSILLFVTRKLLGIKDNALKAAGMFTGKIPAKEMIDKIKEKIKND